MLALEPEIEAEHQRILKKVVDADNRITVDFAARRAQAREEMEPILEQAAETKAEVIDLNAQPESAD